MSLRYRFSVRAFLVLAFLVLSNLSACASTKLGSETPVPYPTYTSSPTSHPTATPFGESFLRDLLDRIQRDDTIPPSGKKAIVTLVGQEPTYVFPDNPGIVLQYLVPLPKTEPEIKRVSVLLIGTGVIMAQEHHIPLWGVEVVFLTEKQEPWFATASIPPWGEGEFRLKPLHPAYIKQLQEAGLITPTSGPTY